MKSIYFVVILVSHPNWRTITKLINKRTFISMRFFAIFMYSVTRLNRILEFQAIWKEIIQSLRFIFHFQIQMGASFHFQSYVFLSGYWIVRDERVYCFRNFFLIYYIFLIQILVILAFISLFTRIYFFVLHRACYFLLFPFIKCCSSALIVSLIYLKRFCYGSHLTGSSKSPFNRSKSI